MLRARAAALAVLLALAPAARAAPPEPLRHDVAGDLTIAGAAAGFWLLTELLKEDLAREQCRFCGANRLDRWTRGELVWDERDAPQRVSDVIAAGVLPAAIGVHALLASRAAGGELRDALVDVMLVAQATLLSADLAQVVKLTIGRRRPFVAFGNFADPNRRPDSDDNLSFYSSHANFAFALAASAGMVSTMRGYRSAPWVWAAGMTLAASVAYFRVAADEHYLTDVVTGAVMGTVLGAGIPWLLHRPRRDDGDGRAREPSGVAIFPALNGIVVRF